MHFSETPRAFSKVRVLPTPRNDDSPGLGSSSAPPPFKSTSGDSKVCPRFKSYCLKKK